MCSRSKSLQLDSFMKYITHEPEHYLHESPKTVLQTDCFAIQYCTGRAHGMLPVVPNVQTYTYVP